MELAQLNRQDHLEYNRFVAGHQSGSFLQAWEWGQWQEQLGHQVQRFFIEDNGQIMLSAQIIQTVIPRLNRTYLYIPHGPLVHSLDNADTKKSFRLLFPGTNQAIPSGYIYQSRAYAKFH